jgi:hypothetical protein
MNKIALSSLIALICAAPLCAQTTTPQSPRFGFSIAYYGHRLTDPGMQFGVERYLATTPNYTVIGSALASAYLVKDVLTAVSLNPRIGLRYTANFGLALESHLGLGYLHRFYQYDEYSVNASGQIVSAGKGSQASVMPNLAVGLGYDFRKTTKLPLLFFTRTGIYYNYPNRHFLFEASYALEVGVVITR